MFTKLFKQLFAVAFIAAPVSAETLLEFCYDPYPPYTLGKGGPAEGGLKVQLLEAVMAEIPGLEAEVTILPWQRCQFLAETGEIDGILPLFRSEEREAYLAFSEEAFLQTSSFWFRRDRDLTAEIEALSPDSPSDLRFGMVSGSIIDAEMEASFTTTTHIQTVDQLLLMLAENRLDLIAIDDTVGRFVRQNHGLKDTLRLSDDPISKSYSYFGLSRASGADKHLEVINLALRHLRKSGLVERLAQATP